MPFTKQNVLLLALALLAVANPVAQTNQAKAVQKNDAWNRYGANKANGIGIGTAAVKHDNQDYDDDKECQYGCGEKHEPKGYARYEKHERHEMYEPKWPQKYDDNIHGKGGQWHGGYDQPEHKEDDGGHGTGYGAGKGSGAASASNKHSSLPNHAEDKGVGAGHGDD